MMASMPGARMPDSFEQMWADLVPVGRSASSGGYFRQPFLSAERELATWFEEQAAARDLVLERDAVGNVVAWWNGIVAAEWAPPDAGKGPKRQGLPRRDAVLTGSHLDSVLDGG